MQTKFQNNIFFNLRKSRIFGSYGWLDYIFFMKNKESRINFRKMTQEKAVKMKKGSFCKQHEFMF